MSEITTVISDFGGVLTTPLFKAFSAVQEESGIPVERLGGAMARIEREDGAHPLYELEKGRMTEADFNARLGRAVEEELGEPVELHQFGERYWSHLRPNQPLIERMRQLRGQGYRMGLLTNNVREWEPRWRAFFPVDEIFEVVVDSAFVGMRKPEPEIYALTCERLGVAPADCLFVDDIEVNCTVAGELGMTPVWFRDNEQALADIDSALSA